MTRDERVRLRAGPLCAEIAPVGAELVRLHHRDHGELLWARDTAVWAGVSPLLFPVVGKVANDRIMVDGVRLAMPQHGFAATSRFAVASRSKARVSFRLVSSERTRSIYPFDFALCVSYVLAGDGLTVTAELDNTGDRVLPASFGFHPAFRWPLYRGCSKNEHFLVFAEDDRLEVFRLRDRLLYGIGERMALDDGRLFLNESLFAEGAAIILDRRSNSIVYGAAGAHFALRIDTGGLPHLGLWMKPGHDYLCIEPWHGHADPIGFAGAFADKPGVFHLAPGGRRAFELNIRIIPAALPNPGSASTSRIGSTGHPSDLPG